MKKTLASLAVLLTAAAPAGAVEWHTVGARALGMGGASVAAAQGPLAAYWNPAALGRPTSNAYGLQIPFGVHAAITGSVIEGANDLEDLKSACAAAPLTCNANNEIQSALDKINQPGNGLRVGADAGADFKVGKIAVFTNAFMDMGAVPFADLQTLNVTTEAVVNATNTSKLTLKGAQVLEFGVGYGRELPFAPGVFLGGNLKLLNATVGYYDYFVLQNNNDDSNMFSKFKNGAKKSSNFGVDLGALWDVNRTFENVPFHPRFGLVGRNLNNPKFNQPDAAVAAGVAGKFAVNPQVRMGASLTPFNWWNITTDLDLTRNLTPVDNVASRQFGVGSEFNVFNRSWVNIPLRVGLTRNLAEPSAGTMLTGGAGLNFLHFIIDASAAVSPERVAVQSHGKTTKVPRELAAAVQLGFLFGGSDQAIEPKAPERKWRGGSYQESPVPLDRPTDKVRAEAEKAQKTLDAEATKK